MAGAGAEGHDAGGQQQLQQGLKMRHMTMISLGGVIGAGLFVGSGAIINSAGPAAVVTYFLTGTIMVFIMRMLGEMAVAQPSVGSFSDYARESLGDWAGFTIGWLYWYFWVIVVGIEAVAGAGILTQYLPGVPPWILCLGLVVLLTLTNLYSVRTYGEFEFWFAGIKVAAIVTFILLGVLFVVGALPDGGPSTLTHLYDQGGFAPNGLLAVFAGIVTVIFSFGGAEIVTIAAAESNEPGRAVARATNQVIYRALLFYVVSVFFIVAVVSWDTPFTEQVIRSPFAVALENIGIPGAGTVMNFVVLTAVLSVLNSSLYTTSRMLFALTRHGDAPQFFTNTTRRGVPMWAIFVGTIFGYVAVAMYYLYPETVFTFLVNSSGAILLFIYLLIAISELRMRRRLEREAPERLQVRMWLFPWLTYLSIACIVAVLLGMAFVPGSRLQLFLSLLSVAVVLAAYALRARRGRRPHPEGEGRG